ncbi:F-box/LRR-repeat protein fbxl-1-like isoform X11 [Periplaneta americana]|uniref:F-box/LRR-repeat protein fbxl-1-like isoform X11 n=1 Tax=Periplaneta americana TaxID=6978 RepID=UPI0037E901DC
MASGKSFSDLPDELLVEIFSYLSIEDLALRVQHVNTHWREVSQDEALWTNKVFMPEFGMSDHEVTRLLKNMPSLKAFCPKEGTKTKVIVNTVLAHCKDIQHLEFPWSNRVKNSKLRKILETFPNLLNLNIGLPKEPYQLEFSRIIGQFQKLTTLGFTDRCVITVVHGVLKALADGCPSLVHIDLGCNAFQDEDVRYFLQKRGHQLSSLSIRSYISSLTHNVLTQCSNLEYLLYDNCNEDLPGSCLSHLSKLSKLRYLKLSYFVGSQGRRIPNIFYNHSLSELVKLSIFNCSGIDASSLNEILINCPQIKLLCFRGYRDSDDGFRYVENLKHLEHFDIAGCCSVTDRTVEYIGAGCKNLKYLDVACCSKLTDKSIEYICVGCPKLRYLNIGRCRLMTDAVFQSIIKFKDLAVLNLMLNNNIFGTLFHMIPSNLSNLIEIYIEGCSLDQDYVEKLQDDMPKLKITGKSLSYKPREEPDIDLEDSTFFINLFL